MILKTKLFGKVSINLHPLKAHLPKTIRLSVLIRSK